MKNHKSLACLLLLCSGSSEVEASKRIGISKQAVNIFKLHMQELMQFYDIKTILEAKASRRNLPLPNRPKKEKSPRYSRPVTLSADQKKELKKICTSSKSTQNEKTRAHIVLLLDAGLKNREIANKIGVHENTVVKWRGRWTGDNSYAKVADYGELTGRPRSVLTPELLETIKQIIKKPPANKTRWTIRGLSKKLGLNIATCQRALKELQIDLTAGHR